MELLTINGTLTRLFKEKSHDVELVDNVLLSEKR